MPAAASLSFAGAVLASLLAVLPRRILTPLPQLVLVLFRLLVPVIATLLELLLLFLFLILELFLFVLELVLMFLLPLLELLAALLLIFLELFPPLLSILDLLQPLLVLLLDLLHMLLETFASFRGVLRVLFDKLLQSSLRLLHTLLMLRLQLSSGRTSPVGRLSPTGPAGRPKNQSRRQGAHYHPLHRTPPVFACRSRVLF